MSTTPVQPVCHEYRCSCQARTISKVFRFRRPVSRCLRASRFYLHSDCTRRNELNPASAIASFAVTSDHTQETASHQESSFGGMRIGGRPSRYGTAFSLLASTRLCGTERACKVHCGNRRAYLSLGTTE